MGSYIGIDEVALSQGELYTVVINKGAKKRKGSIIAIVRGTQTQAVCGVLLQMSRKRRFQAWEITLDMAPNMELIAKTCFPAARRVIDRFHIQKQAYDAVQQMRIQARWEALDMEALDTHQAKCKGERYTAPVFDNGDSLKQLLARSRYLLLKKETLWTDSQKQRAHILFEQYPHIKKAYYLAMQLGLIYHQTKSADVALTKFARWYDLVDKSGFLSFGTIARTIQTHYLNIVNFFFNRSTNAASESFNAKIKAFRAQFRGVKDKTFFLFRLAMLYA